MFPRKKVQMEILDAWNELATPEKGLPLPLGGRNVNGIFKIKTLGGSLGKHSMVYRIVELEG